jgi:hypothetical protein
MQKIFLKITLIVMIIFLFSSSSYSSDWVYIGYIDTDYFYIDCDSLMLEGHKVTFWSKAEEKDAKNVTVKQIVDCKKRLFRLSYGASYDSNGSLLDSVSVGDEGQWKGINPYSMMDRIRKLLCNEDNKPRKDVKNFLKSWEIMLRSKGIIK